MEKQVFSYIKQYQMIAPGDSVIVGVSGGADSVCLLLLLKEYQKREKFSLEAVHVHHGIRGEEADQDAEYVQNLCKRLGVPCTVFRKDIPAIAKEQGLSLEETGRNVRRELFMEVLKAKGTGVIALAHHQDDLAETMLHHLAREAGLQDFAV